MNPPVFFLQGKIIFHLIILRIDAAGHFIGKTQEPGPVKPVIIEQKP
jgi:hypothetical protein